MGFSFIDGVNAWWVLLLTIVILLAFAELGFRVGRRHRDEPGRSERKSQAGGLLAALLALLALMLAFSFSIVEGRFSSRKQLVIQEANAIGTVYLRANMLPEPHGTRVRSLLRDYVNLRIVSGDRDELERALRRSEAMHSRLWTHADAVAEAHPESEIVGLFVRSLNELIDLHEERLSLALHQRLPVILLATLYLVAILGMAVLGYGAGLARTRPILPLVATVLAISTVMVLIVELDRPFQRVFQINQQALVDVQETMSKEY